MGWNRKRTQLQAYFAGLFDGEGSVGIYSNSNERPSTRAVVTVKMTDGSSVALMQKEYPEGVFKYVPKSNPKHNPTMDFILYDYAAYRFLKEIKPFVLVKWEQVKVALSYLVHKRREHGYERKHPLPCPTCQHFVVLIKELKIVEDKGKKTVNLWAKHGLREYRGEPQQVIQDIKDVLKYYELAEEAVETRVRETNKPISLPEQEIVQTEPLQ